MSYNHTGAASTRTNMAAPEHLPVRAAATSNLPTVTPRRKFTPTPKTGLTPSTSPRKASNASTPRTASSASSSRSASATHSSVSDAQYATPKSSIASLRKAAAAAASQLPSYADKRNASKIQQSPGKGMTTSPTKRTGRFAAMSKQKGSTDAPVEPIKAFLRIRPTPEDDSSKAQKQPYIDVVSDTEVLMNPPRDASAPRARVYSSAVPTKYAFSRVFRGDATNHSETSQNSFFQTTTLPLVDELLQGQSGLIFTYGVTNSGKSYTVQGGSGVGEAGILPRSMDVIFNSIKGLESTSKIRPVGLTGVEHATLPPPTDSGVNPFSLPGLNKKLNRGAAEPLTYEHDDTAVRVDRNYRYSVWVSYIEVYNEKIFDLLDAAPQNQTGHGGMSRSPSVFGGMARTESMRGLSNWTIASSESNAGTIFLQRKPLSLKNDSESGGKYVAGLHEIRVNSPAEAHELLRRGQENRRVFATMANRTSSRSHGVFTVKVIREHAGEDDLSVACSTSRLSIVDLAGSERLGNTSATGDRLKEAGNINKSLMCLGQCLETLRKNQSRSVVPMLETTSSKPPAGSNGLPRILNRRPSLVPFRHSKLTELFQSFFMGEGRAVMIVNVNPYDTGFDENSHVMRFSAAAKEVHTVRTPGHATNLSRFVHPSLRNLFHGGSATATPPPLPVINHARAGYLSPPPSTPKNLPVRGASRDLWSPPGITSPPQAIQLSTLASKKNVDSSTDSLPQESMHKESSVQAGPDPDGETDSHEVTILEGSDDEDDDSDADPFVAHLMQRYEEMRQLLFESEMRCASIEREVREEMAEEMSERLLEMEKLYNERMLADAEQNEIFVNRKLDLLAQASALDSQRKSSSHRDQHDAFRGDESMLSRFSDDSIDDSQLVEHSLAVHKPLPMRRASEADEDGTSVDDGEGDSHIAEESSLLSTHTAEDADKIANESVSTSATASTIAENEQGNSRSFVQDFEVSVSADEDDDANATDEDATRRSDKDTNEVGERSLESEEDEDDEEAEIEEEDEEEEEEEEGEEEDDSSDESFDATEESIESSFEAPPRARTSRARQSASVRGRATNSRSSVAVRRTPTGAKAKTKSSPSRTKRNAPSAPARPLTSRKQSNRPSQPFTEASYNASTLSRSESGEFCSDSSLIIASKTPKASKQGQQQDDNGNEENQHLAVSPSKAANTPKKKRMLVPAKGRRTNPMSREALVVEQNSDVSLMEAMQRRIVS